MTSRTTGQNICFLNVILRLQIRSQRDLVLCAVPRSPFHVKDFLFRPQVVLRMAMTIKAPFHLQRLRLRHDRHLIDAPVTSRATDTLVHMNRMIEISEVRQVMHAHPFQRSSRFVAVTDWFEIWTVGPNLFVAIHADGRRRHARRGGRLDRSVTVTAIDAVIADVMFMAELDWLLALDPLARVPA